MIEKTFSRPSARDLIKRVMGDLPGNISERFVSNLIGNNALVPTGEDYRSVVETVESLKDYQLALLPSSFRVPISDSNYGIKSLSDLVKIDSQQALRNISYDAPEKLTKAFTQEYKIWPYTLIKTSMADQDVEDPPIGFYWVGGDGHARATTWLRSVTGAEMKEMKKKGDFDGGVIDKKPYGDNLRVSVRSREEDKFYEFTLSRLPMHERGDPAQFSDWINIGHNSPDPDNSYRGIEHDQRENPVVLFSAPTIFAFYSAMEFVRKHPDWKQFRINPFPIPTEEMDDFADALRLKTLILDDSEGKLRVKSLNKTEIEKVLGAKTRMSGYDNCWFHWGKRDTSYLYKAE